jgi:hypothetical protein
MRECILQILDWDSTWIGLGWLRPRKEDPITANATILISLLTSFFAGLSGPLLFLLYALRGNVELTTMCLLSGCATAGSIALNVILQMFSAVCWNERAAQLRAIRVTEQN